MDVATPHVARQKRHRRAGPTCVNTEIGSVNLGSECAQGMLQVSPSTGLISEATITFPLQSGGWPQAFNDWLAAHELAHLVGPGNNNSSCQTSQSVMKPVTCGANSGFPQTPTLSDHLAAARSTYQGQTTSICQ